VANLELYPYQLGSPPRACSCLRLSPLHPASKPPLPALLMSKVVCGLAPLLAPPLPIPAALNYPRQCLHPASAPTMCSLPLGPAHPKSCALEEDNVSNVFVWDEMSFFWSKLIAILKSYLIFVLVSTSHPRNGLFRSYYLIQFLF
jgi:hypothetical protein